MFRTRSSFRRPKRRAKQTYEVGEFNDEDRTDSHGILSRIQSLCLTRRLHEEQQNLDPYGKKEDPQAACTQPIQPRNTPIEYSKWRQAIIDTNNIEREFRDATSHHTTIAAPSSKDTAAAHDKTRLKSGSKSKSKDKKKPFFFYRKPTQTPADRPFAAEARGNVFPLWEGRTLEERLS